MGQGRGSGVGLGHLRLVCQYVRSVGGFVRLADAIKHRMIGEFHAFRVRLIPEDALLNMTLLLTGRAANGAHELQRKVLLNHMLFLRLLDPRKMVNIEHSANYPLSPWT